MYYCILGETLKTITSSNSPPLVVGVDIPDAALNEDLVLVHGQQGAQREGSHLLHHDRVAGTVTLEALSRELKKLYHKHLRSFTLSDLF